MGPSTARQKLARRACDSCKVRKIRCTEVAPCAGCVSSGIECTFTRLQAQRGPRGLRAETKERIDRSRRQKDSPKLNKTSVPRYCQNSHLSDLLDIIDKFTTRLYPIWPIVDTAKLKQTLLVDPNHASSRRLADAVALATVAQLKLKTPWQADPQGVERHESGSNMSLLDNLRISFFLHIYYENLEAGGAKSLLLLREAVTQAQILRLEHESTYTTLPEVDQQVSRRVLWLLFITERGVALLHKLPAILKPNNLFPWYGYSDESAHVLPAFFKLVHLFWVFDQSGIFDILRHADSDGVSMDSLARNCLELLQQKLQDTATEDDLGPGNDVQRADMCVTRQWMRAVLWRAALRFGVVIPAMNPVNIAKEFLSSVSMIPPAALESHGPTLELKTFEIATSVVDAMAMAKNNRGISIDQPEETLHQLRDIISSSRGGNNQLLSLLDARICSVSAPSIPRQLYSTDYTEMLSNMDDQGSWRGETILPQLPFLSMPLSSSAERGEAPVSWPNLDLGSLIRSPSPLTRMLLDAEPREETNDSFTRWRGELNAGNRQ